MRVKGIAGQASAGRFDALNCVLKEEGKEAIGHCYSAPERFLTDLNLLQKEADYIFVGEPFQTEVLKSWSDLDLLIQVVGWCDGLLWKNHRWWPQCLLYHGLRSVVTRQELEVSLEGSVLAVGLGPAVRPTIAAAIGLGYRRIGLVATPSKESEELVSFFQSRFFGVQMAIIPPEEAVSLPGMTSILINTVEGSQNESLLKYLYYFNFMSPGGLVIDLSLAETELLKNAELFGAKNFSGVEIFSEIDKIWLRDIAGLAVDFSRLKSSWTKALSAA